jgi:two-component system cell cycle sensor histidine kinase/response regulator CckA
MPDDSRRSRPTLSEALLTGILDAALDAVITIDPGGAIHTWNAQAGRMFGWEASEVIGRMLATTIIPTRYREQHEQGLARARAGGTPTILNRRIELTALHRDGHEIPVELTVTRVPLRDSWLFSAFVRDLTEQKRPELELRRTTEFLSTFQAMAQVGSWVWDMATNVMTCSDETCRLLGRHPGDSAVSFDTYLALLHPDDREPVETAVLRALETASPFEVDHRVVLPDGSIRYLHGRVGIVSDAEGRPLRMIGTVLDISARRHAEDALRRANDRWRAVIESAPLALVVLDPAGFVQTWNPAAERLFGWTAIEAIGRFLPMVPAEELPEFLVLRRRVLGGEQITGTELVHQTKQGGRINVKLFAAPLHDAEGGVTGILELVEDGTAVKRLEQQAFEAQQMETVARLVGGVAHDFNNLLTVIMAGCELVLMELADPDPKRADLREIRQAADRATLLTRQLLAFSRQQLLAPQIVNLNVLLAGIEGLLQRLLGDDIELQRIAGLDLGAVEADPGQLEQVIMNLVVNARDAMPRGGKLTIETANVEVDPAFAESHPPIEPGSYVMIAVRDTGTAMDEHTRAHLASKGTGLGLATVYGIVKQGGGCIYASNEPGGRAGFWIYLPRVGPAAKPEPRLSAVPGSLSGTETILLVEDDSQVRAVAVEVLKRYGYSVLDAADVDSALALEERHAGPLHLLITEEVLPLRSGEELASSLRARWPELRVLVMSGFTDRVSLVREGADGFLQKPFGPVTLARKVRETLESPRS